MHNRKLFTQGDLQTLAQLRRFIAALGIDAGGHLDLYPSVAEADYPKVLQALWDNLGPNWDRHHDEYVRLGICTPEQFRAAREGRLWDRHQPA
jgi:hypothetical protein